MPIFQHHQSKWLGVFLVIICWCLDVSSMAWGNHRGSDDHAYFEANDRDDASGHLIPWGAFQVFWVAGQATARDSSMPTSQVEDTVQTVVKVFSQMVKHRNQYHRFDEALTKRMLQKVIIEPRVFNREGKEFMFLVARTKYQGQVKLLINAAALKEKELVNHPDQLVPLLEREFQWVVSKADTSKKPPSILGKRNLIYAPILAKKVIDGMTGEEREIRLLSLFENYLTTLDEYKSLHEQTYYEIGSSVPVSSAQPDSTAKLYDIRVRQALQRIVREPEFLQNTPKAARNLLNGKIWNVSFVHIDSRDWATRTRVLPKDKAVKVGEKGKIIQPAKILINFHRKAAPGDPYYDIAKNLPMGALSTEQLAQVIALEIEKQIIEKSMRGHVVSDEQSVPK